LSNPSGPGSGKSSREKQKALLQIIRNSQEVGSKRNFFDTCLEDEFFEDLKNDQELTKEHFQVYLLRGINSYFT